MRSLLRFMRFGGPWLLAACGARTGLDGPGDVPSDVSVSVAFPVGEYTECAMGIYSTSGGLIGVDRRAVLSLTQQGAAVHARFVDQNDARSDYDFALTTGATAALVPGGSVPGSPHACVRGVGVVARQPTTIRPVEGSLVADRDGVFLVAQGTATDVSAGPCGVQSDVQSVWIACTRRDRATPVASVGASASSLPTGTFACQSQLATYVLAGGINQYAANGATGALTITQRGGALSLSYAGDRSVSATADFALTSNVTAHPSSASGFSAVCDVPISTPAATAVAPMNVSTGALTLIGSTLFVNVAGTMRGPCEGAEKFVALRCELR